MSWHGPSAPRVEGIATKSRVVASCMSKPASTASRIFCLVSAAIICVVVPVSADQTILRPRWAGALPAFQNRQRVPTLRAMTASRIILGFALFAATAALSFAQTQHVAREQDIVGLRLGQRVMVDDGTCPSGQIKEISGARMTPSGVTPARTCVPRLAAKKK